MKIKEILIGVGAVGIVYGLYGYYKNMQAEASGVPLSNTEITTYWVAAIGGAVLAASAHYYPHYIKHIESKLEQK